jgi:YjeF C-terminal domain protein
VLGPGLSTDYYAKIIVEYVLAECYVPMIIDADALNIIAADTTLTKYYTDNIIITPHIGEMSRLIDVSIEDILSDPVKYAEEYANKYGITVVLKSHQSVIAAKEDTFINKSGSAAMAKAGSGDVLCGIIAGMFCLGIDDDMAVALGVFIHGMAGNMAGKKYGEHSILAREIIENIGEVLNRRKRNGLI